jgi:hypothetical protein
MPLRSPNTLIAFLAPALLLSTACKARRLADARQSAPLTPVAQEIQRRGYHAKETLVVPPTIWEASTLRMRSKRFFSFRADQPQPGSRDYFCRFSLFEETYDSIDDARRRLANLHVAAPDGLGVDEYRLGMRTGFRVGTVTYFLETDAIIFWDEVQRLAKALANATPGAELTRYSQRTAEQAPAADGEIACFSNRLFLQLEC